MNNTPGPSPQHTPASVPAPSPATVASRHAARSTTPKPGAEQRRTRPRRAVRPSGEPDAAKPKPKPKPKPHPPARHERPATPEAANKKPQQPQQADSSTDAADYPYVALTLQTTGIHPSTGRIVTIDAIAFNDAGEQGQLFHTVLKPDIDAGPRHLHGLSTTDIEQAPAFGKILKSLDKLIDGRTLIVHDLPYTWGFLVAEARRAMMAAARQNRARNRGRNKGRRRRQKVGHVPTPVRIIDTLATSYAQQVRANDVRLGGVAKQSGLDSTPQASVERAARPETETSREDTELLIALYRKQEGGTVRSYAPEDVRADRFGLQRSHVRVDAAEAPVQHHNPGKYEPGKELRRGMEIVVAPEILEDPDTIIAALMREELNYSEKLTRESSLVVCNVTTDLVGKPMHAHRKGIPLMSDAAFLDALTRIEDAEPEPESTKPAPRAHRSSQNNKKGGGKNQKRRRRRGGRGGRGRGRRNSGGSAGKKND
ncbi:MAG: DNA polymerase III subunit epsilon [Corynebacterium sp.]|uniref:DNA polymerase III subunit epsilon n=1 Tax=unclassified Corynebacterium TaxID=2624378 RepID=UPI000ABAB2F2|nr:MULTISPECIES: DNA polymerase III subunit epsilon [unclassified Corynebacterium]MDU1462956.1 DNA polymerase III subunit epsilon [Corynebacterium sp.]